MKHTILAVLGFSLALVPLAAQAQDYNGDGYDDAPQAQVAPPPAQPGGHYQWQNVSRWVPAHAEQFVIPGACWTRGHRWHARTVCSPSRYASRVVPGHYVQSGRWVWMADAYPSDSYQSDPGPYQQDPGYQDPGYQQADPGYQQDPGYQPAPSQYEPAPSGGFDLRVGPRGVRVGIHVSSVATR